MLSLRLLSISAAALLVASPAPVDSLAFHAEEGTAVTRTFDFELEMSLESMNMTMNGEDLPSDHFEGFELDFGERDHIVVSDVYGAPADGRPSSVTRTFTELSGESTEASTGPDGPEEKNEEKSSDLEGSTVIFTWDAEEDAYSVEFDDGGDDDLLADLEEDMDLRGFLPDGEVDEGDTWETDIEPFRRLFEAGGDLHVRSADEKRTELDEELSDNLDGEVRVTYAGLRDEGGVEVAVLELEITASTEGEGGEESPMEGETVSTVTMEFELEGELLWNVTAGHLHSAEVSGEIEAEIENASEFEGPNGAVELLQIMQFSGSITLTANVEAE